MPPTDPPLRSFVPVAADSHFPIQNLPYGVFQPAGKPPRVGVAIGDFVLDLALLETQRVLYVEAPHAAPVFARPSLNALMALGPAVWRDVRDEISRLLRHDTTTLRDNAGLREAALIPQRQVEMLLPVEIGDYTDFYSSRHHAENVGSLFRDPQNALPENWLHLPAGYHGRSSSIVVSGTEVRRPAGQTRPAGAAAPLFGPSRAVDFELEMGFVIGTGSELGRPVPAAKALEHVFGMVLVNDWSARDIQRWEYVPLGPFLAKSFATTISPWVVPLDALAPFAVGGPPQEPPPLDYLKSPGNPTWDVRLEAWLAPAGEREPVPLCRSNLRHVYWNIRQQVAHHTIGGCNLRPGDLLATGTISGPADDSRGCLLEITNGGKDPLVLPAGGERRYLEDGDRVTLTGWCQGDTYRVGFGEATGRLLSCMTA